MNIKKCIAYIVFLVLATFSFSLWNYKIIKEHHQKNMQKIRERRNVIFVAEAKEKEKKSVENKTFNKKYSVIHEENLSTPTSSRFSQSIYVPLGLSNEELKENLLHAANSLKREKKADSVIIFAYREDDIKRDGGFTAGRYILNSNLTTKFDIAEVYSKNKKIYPAKSKAIIDRNNTKLYSKKEFEPNDVITKLKEGTKVMILEHSREFATTDILDLYKILVLPNEFIGWVMDPYISEQ